MQSLGPKNIVGRSAYRIARGATWAVARTYWRMKIVGQENVPAEGPFLLCPVHRSNIDGPISAAFTTRQMAYLAKGEMFKPAPFRRLIISMGAIAVNRGTPDRQSLKTCLDVLLSGSPLVLFPEGGRRSGPVVEPLQEGAVYLASKAKVPIIPVGIAGSEEANPKGTVLPRPAKLYVIIGEPIVIEQPPEGARLPRSVIREKTDLLQQTLQELFDSAKAMHK